jgi:hypothetical protein
LDEENAKRQKLDQKAYFRRINPDNSQSDWSQRTPVIQKKDANLDVDWLCEQSQTPGQVEEEGEEEIEEEQQADEDLPSSGSLSSVSGVQKKLVDNGDATLSKLFSTNESVCYECDQPVDRDKFTLQLCGHEFHKSCLKQNLDRQIGEPSK